MPAETYYVGSELDSIPVASVALAEVAATGVASELRAGVNIPSPQYADLPLLDPVTGAPTNKASLWFHFLRDSGDGGANLIGFTFRKADGTQTIREIVVSTFVSKIQVFVAGAWTDTGISFTRPYHVYQRFDIQIVDGVGTAGKIRCHVNESLVGEWSGDTTALGPFGSVRFFGMGLSSNRMHIAGMIIANYNTLGHVVRRRTPTVDGFHVAWTGTFADIDEAIPVTTTDNVAASALDAKETFNSAASPALGAGQTIKAVAVGAFVRNSADAVAPQNLRGLLRSGTVDYEAAANMGPGVNTGYTGHVSIWQVNPATNAPFADMAAVNAIEFGLVAKA